jgi:hypothetical protein
VVLSHHLLQGLLLFNQSLQVPYCTLSVLIFTQQAATSLSMICNNQAITSFLLNRQGKYLLLCLVYKKVKLCRRTSETINEDIFSDYTVCEVLRSGQKVPSIPE